MLDRYVVHVHLHAHDDPQYITGHIDISGTGYHITGHIDISGTGYQRFFSGYAGLQRALSGTARANEPAAGQGRHEGT
jgi:hypothetical protein